MDSKFAGLGLPVDKPTRMPLVHPNTRQPLRDANGQDAWIELLSSDSEKARKHNIEIQRRRLRAARGRLRIEPEEIEADSVELLAVLTSGWHLCGLDSTPLDVPCSIENARELYGTPGLAWLREQVDEFVTDRVNFGRASSKK